MSTLPLIAPLERIRLSGELSSKTLALATVATPIERVRLSGRIVELLTLLGAALAVAPDPIDDGLSDDPNSPNYRYRDTGYIADSRKEQAQNLIRTARLNGDQVLPTDLDWDAIESNPRAAAEIITKSNLFGQVDWSTLREAGMEPGAGFLIDRIYAAIAPQPGADTPRARRDYATALQTIRQRLESCTTSIQVTDVLGEIRDELTGTQLNAEETAQYEGVQVDIDALSNQWRALDAERKVLSDAYTTQRSALWAVQSEQDKRLRRKWKPDDSLQAEIDRLQPLTDAAQAEVVAWDEAHPEYKDTFTTARDADGGISTVRTGGLRADISALRDKQRAIEQLARARNISESSLTRGWITFGDRFFQLLNYRGYRGSSTFQSHVTNAKNGKIDWSWAEKERVIVKRATKKEIGFQLKVAERHQRVGGRQLSVDSTFALKELLGLREVQSGNWVLKDRNSARYHVEQTAMAMSDLSDVLGIDIKALSLGGRLSMAFGARGQGNAGWGGAAAAHYESVHRVINLTKLGGGGCLGHEWFHAIDDMLAELVKGEAGPARNFASLNADVLPEGALREAMTEIRAQMTRGDRRLVEAIKVTDRDRALATRNIDEGYPNAVARGIKLAGELTKAVLFVDGYFAGRDDKRSLKNRKAWRALAAAYYAPAGEAVVQAATGPAVSNFYAEAVRLDGGEQDKYWSKGQEMAARAFQSYLEDRLQGRGQQNDYLSIYADNKYHYDALLGIQWNPYPEGDERTRINAAFDRFFEALRTEQVLERASENTALLDAVFGPAPDEPEQELARLLGLMREYAPEGGRIQQAQRVMELIPLVAFDDPHTEDEIVAMASEILAEVDHA
ncbi:hypothetical protein BJP27_24055 (plasmid) [Pseudomonas oryzihabitans]|nr:hypothetical protein BJP27_24055 [Pseudomonas psychrotolerans]